MNDVVIKNTEEVELQDDRPLRLEDVNQGLQNMLTIGWFTV